MVQNRFKELRKNKGYSQDELSSLTNIPQTTLSNWEKGQIDPIITRLIRLENVLGLKIADILPSPPEICRKVNKTTS